jgi:hypothetical protein
VGAKRALELLDRLDVEMVRRFVEQEHIEVAAERCGERCARLLATRSDASEPARLDMRNDPRRRTQVTVCYLQGQWPDERVSRA